MSAECAPCGGVVEVCLRRPPPVSHLARTGPWIHAREAVYLQDELGSFLFTGICHSNGFGDGGFSFLTLVCSIALDQLGPKDEESGMNLPILSREDWDSS